MKFSRTRNCGSALFVRRLGGGALGTCYIRKKFRDNRVKHFCKRYLAMANDVLN